MKKPCRLTIYNLKKKNAHCIVMNQNYSSDQELIMVVIVQTMSKNSIQVTANLEKLNVRMFLTPNKKYLPFEKNEKSAPPIILNDNKSPKIKLVKTDLKNTINLVVFRRMKNTLLVV